MKQQLVFPEHFLRCMSAKDRQALGQMTAGEAAERYARGQECKLKRDVLNWLNLRGAWVFEQRMDKRTRGKRGTPDILACVPPAGRFLAIELKVAGGRLLPAQATEIKRIEAAGGVAVVARCLEDVIAGIQKARESAASQLKFYARES